MEKKIRELQMKRNKQRQTTPTINQMPAPKKRKNGESEYRKVFSEPKEKVKRKPNEQPSPDQPAQKKRKEEEIDDQPGEEEQARPHQDADDQEDHTHGDLQHQVHYGEWQEVEKLDFDYEKHIKEYEDTKEKEKL